MKRGGRVPGGTCDAEDPTWLIPTSHQEMPAAEPFRVLRSKEVVSLGSAFPKRLHLGATSAISDGLGGGSSAPLEQRQLASDLVITMNT